MEESNGSSYYEPAGEYPGDVVMSAEMPPVKERKLVWGGWATFGFGILIIFVTAVIQVVIGVIIGIVAVTSQQIGFSDIGSMLDLMDEYAGAIVAIATIINGIIGTALILLLIKVKKGLGIREYLGFSRFSSRSLIYSVMAVIGFIGLSYLVQILTGYSEASSGDGFDIYNTAVWPVAIWIAVCVVAPFYEEIWIRGFMYKGFINSGLGIVGTFVVTSMFWAVQHIQYQLFGIAIIFAFGILLAYVRFRSKSIWPPVVMHAVNNIVALALMAAA